MKMIIDNDDDDEGGNDDNNDDDKYDDYSDNDDDDDFFYLFSLLLLFSFSASTYLSTMHCFITLKAVLGQLFPLMISKIMSTNWRRIAPHWISNLR